MPAAWGHGGVGQVQRVGPGGEGAAGPAPRSGNALESVPPYERYRCRRNPAAWPLEPLYRIQASLRCQHRLTPGAPPCAVLATGAPRPAPREPVLRPDRTD